jgi:predicted DNA-binding ribbon-helix-helix protein
MATDKRISIKLDTHTWEKLERITSIKKLNTSDTIRELITGRSVDIDELKDQLKEHTSELRELVSAVNKLTTLVGSVDDSISKNQKANLTKYTDIKNYIMRVIMVQFCHYRNDETWKKSITEKFPKIINKPDDFSF